MYTNYRTLKVMLSLSKGVTVSSIKEMLCMCVCGGVFVQWGRGTVQVRFGFSWVAFAPNLWPFKYSIESEKFISPHSLVESGNSKSPSELWDCRNLLSSSGVSWLAFSFLAVRTWDVLGGNHALAQAQFIMNFSFSCSYIFQAVRPHLIIFYSKEKI